MDWDKASVELSKKLNPSNVQPPKQFGPKGSYIEGWLAIQEANRIFGFGGWSYTILDCKAVMESARQIGKGDRAKDGFGVTYVATVRVTVGDVTRDDVGSGHGYDVDLGLAHESAIKESVTDALKRSLRSFGNPFGLALYDKSRENVGENVDDGAVAEAVGCFDKADTLEAANGIWRDLPAALKADQRVIDAAKAAKARNKPQVAA